MVHLFLLLLPLGQLQGQEGVPQFDSVIVVFAEEDPGSFVSSFGHLFVCLPTRPVGSTSDLMGATALNVGADLSPQGQGAWIGEYKLRPFHEMVRKNIRAEQRTLFFFELGLTADHVRLLQQDLQQRAGQEYPYEFFRKNCGYYLLNWLNGENVEPSEVIYLTPREALDQILERYPPRRIWQLPTDLALLEDYLAQVPNSDSRLVASSLTNPQKLKQLRDLTLRLLTIKVAESRSKRTEYDELQAIRNQTLAEPGGDSAAIQLVQLQELAYDSELTDWAPEAEGPSISFGSIYRPGRNQEGIRLHAEAGLRDCFSAPPSKRVLREVRFLSTTIDATPEDTRADFLLAAVDTQRSFSGIAPATSNGGAIGYAGLPNTLGLSGLYTSAWAGLSLHTGDYWLGSRLTVGVENLQSKLRALAAPGLTLERRAAWSTTSLSADLHLQDGAGWAVEQFAALNASTTLSVGWLRSPHGEDVLTLSVQIRF